MKPSKTRLLATVTLAGLLSATAIMQTGCLFVAAGAGAGTVAYIRGELNSPLEASLDQAIAATRKAIDELKFHQISDKADALSAEFQLRDAQDDSIRVLLKRQTDNLTNVSIRVGTFGDEAISQTVLEKIKNHL